MTAMRKTQELAGIAPDRIPFGELLEAGKPAVLKAAAAHWPLVRHGLESPLSAMEYLRGFATPRPASVYTAPPELAGRFAYDENFTALNFKTERLPLGECFDRLARQLNDPHAASLYAGSTDVDLFLPGLRAENDLALSHPMFEHARPVVSIWLGNRTVAAAHFDVSHNLACGMVGRRRFTLFPPEQVHNLYPGPLEPTPGGQVVSVVDFRAPDFTRYPRFREALAAAEVAELAPGDVLFYPALWWHHVEALESFNAMINYWWNTSPGFMDSPQNTLQHALLSLRGRPEGERRAWREIFDYYVFGPPERAAGHLPEAARGNLGPLDENKARRLRANLLSRLNR